MVILISQNKITDFFVILAWASPFNCAWLFKFILFYWFIYLSILLTRGQVACSAAAIVRFFFTTRTKIDQDASYTKLKVGISEI